MASRRHSILALSILLGLCLHARPASASGEEDKAKKAKQEAKAPEDTVAPKEPETIDPSLTEADEPTPIFEVQAPAAAAPPPAPRRPTKGKDLDENIDYSRLLGYVDTIEAPRGVLAPAPGFRGYRPNMVAIGGGDRVPGFGAMVEYSWNRFGWGFFASYRNTKGEDQAIAAYGIGGTYVLYRWLPWDVSPYILMGAEIGSATTEPIGGLTGLGVEARIYSGWTVLIGWTFHSVVRRGFMGGALGWSF